MDNKKIGHFIASLRKEKSMTQQDLADILNVTSKAVSKWETGQGYPEITSIPLLAEALGVSTSELLMGERDIKENDNDVARTIINHTIQYYEKTKMRKTNIFVLIFFLMTIVSAFVCLLCNYLLNGQLNWSLYPIGAFIVVWAVIIPLIKIRKYKLFGAILGFSVTSILYLFLIQHLAPAKGWVVTLALPIAILSIIVIGSVLFMFIYSKWNRFYKTAITVFLFGVVINFGVNRIVEGYLHNSGSNDISNFVTTISSIFLSAILLAIGYVKMNKTHKHSGASKIIPN